MIEEEENSNNIFIGIKDFLNRIMPTNNKLFTIVIIILTGVLKPPASADLFLIWLIIFNQHHKEHLHH